MTDTAQPVDGDSHSAQPATPSANGARFVELMAWLVVAFVGSLLLTQTVGWAGTRLVAVAQTLTPYFGLLLGALTAVALWRRRWLLATVAAAVTIGIAALATPLALVAEAEPAHPDATGLTVAAANLWYRNADIVDTAAALADLDADVLVLSEYTPEHQAALQASGLADTYPHRIDRRSSGGAGIAVWSRLAVDVGDPFDSHHASLDLTVAGPDGDVRVIAMHMPTPIDDFDDWRRDLRTAADFGRSAVGPTLLIGDLNASFWHPDFRRLLDAGFVDANAAAGSGFSTSWPTDRIVPPFVRLDHALTAGGLVSTDVADFDVPGSDHLGVVVTVAPTLPAAP